MIVLFLFYLVTLFLFPKASIQAASAALQVWLQRLIPTLFPFMVISQIFIDSGILYIICKPLNFFIQRILRVSEPAFLCIIFGVFAGFPMGAKTVAVCYLKGELTKNEAEYLLSFCNVLGPMYFFGYVLPLIEMKYSFLAGIGLYGIPFLYGIILRHTKYKDIFDNKIENQYSVSNKPIVTVLEKTIADSAETLLLLGGNIIFFSVWSVIPKMLNQQLGQYLSPLIEISSGIDCLGNNSPIYSLIAVSFGGICCLLQTKCCLMHTDLSMKKYVLHKMNVVLLTVFYYLLLHSIFV